MTASLASSSQLWQTAAWTMLHFLWVGAAIAVVGMAARVAGRGRRTAVRYALSAATLLALAVAPLAIAWRLTATDRTAPVASVDVASVERGRRPSTHPGLMIVELADQTPPGDVPNARQTVRPTPAYNPPARTDRQANPWELAWIWWLPWIWIVGAPVTFAWLATGLVGAERLRRSSVPSAPAQAVCNQLRATLGMSRNVAVAVCDRLAEPVLIGILRPLILLPSAALSGWSPAELEMVLLHELAHVRRWDNLVNLLQRVVESALFFHPCVWLVSRQVRRDREDCCDAAVLRRTAQPQAYAQLLVTLAASRGNAAASWAGSAMAGHPLAGRIRRILKLEEEPMMVNRSTLGLLTFAAAVVVAGVLLATAGDAATAQRAANGESEQQSAAERGTTPEPHAARAADEPTDQDPLAGPRPQATNQGRDPFSPFPTLAEQRAADLAYQRIGLELETLDQQELQRVRARNFAGGLRISSAHDHSGGALQPDDILVGLHVWPTTTLADVMAVLKRDDLNELSPLKFYVIRRVHGAQGSDADPFGGHNPPKVDRVITGRIYVYNANRTSRATQQAEQEQQRSRTLRPMGMGRATQKPVADDAEALMADPRPGAAHGSPKIAAGDAIQVAVDGDLPDRQIDGFYVVEAAGTIALGPTYGRAEVAGLTIGDAEKQLRTHLQTILKDPAVQITLAPTSGAQDGAVYLYDGKPFDHWRDLWKYELSTQKRIAAVEALAAFGRTGYGAEAGRAILDVAAEYSLSMDDPAIEPLKAALRSALSGARRLPLQDWIPHLVSQLESTTGEERRRWIALGQMLLGQLGQVPADLRPSLVKLTENDDLQGLHGVIAVVLLSINPDDPIAISIARRALAADEPDLAVFGRLHFRLLDQIPEQLDLLFQNDPRTRNAALASLLHAPSDVRASVVDELVKLVEDRQAQPVRRQVNVIRALGVAVPRRSGQEVDIDKDQVVDVLQQTVVSGDVKLVAPALLALELWKKEAWHVVLEKIVKSDELSQERKQLLESQAGALISEERELESRAGHEQGGGGFF